MQNEAYIQRTHKKFEAVLELYFPYRRGEGNCPGNGDSRASA